MSFYYLITTLLNIGLASVFLVIIVYIIPKNINFSPWIFLFRMIFVSVVFISIQQSLKSGKAVNIYCADQKKYVIFKKMNEIESVLDDQCFFRINRQMIINRDAVKEIKYYFNRKIIVQAAASSIEQKIIVSRLKVTPFLNWLEKPI